MSHWEDEGQPYSPPYDLFVCPDCVTDQYLADILKEDLDDEPCSYCGKPSAASVSLLCDAIKATIEAYYVDPAEELPYDTSEGGYQGEVLSGSEIVTGEFDPWTDCDQLADDVASAFVEGTWCERDYFGLDQYEILSYGWQGFSETVKHRTRYFFLREPELRREYGEEIAPKDMLDALDQLFREFNLFVAIPERTDIFRGRVVKTGDRPATAAELGTAPREVAIFPNRMSPAGVPMFYGALEERTVLAEIYSPKGRSKKNQEIVLACFQNQRPLLMLDLTRLPEVPSVFDLRKRREYQLIAFLRAFERDFTKPVPKKNRGHTEYVPTQIVTEFVRDYARTADDKQIDGIIYKSSQWGGSRAVVVFAEEQHCGPRKRDHFDPEQFLLLDSTRTRYLPNEEIRAAISRGSNPRGGNRRHRTTFRGR